MKKMMQMMLTTAMVIFTMAIGQAQTEPTADNDGKKREKIEALKRAYLTEKLELTVAEAEKFWPIYNANDKQQTEIRKSIRSQHKALKEGTKTEKDALAAMEVITQKRKEEVDIEAKLFKDCLPVLGVEKTIKLASAEREFHHEVMKRMKDRGGDKGQKGPKGDKGLKDPK